FDQVIDFLFGTDVNAARRLVEEQHAWPEQQPFGQYGLLLVAAAEVQDEALAIGRADIQTLNHGVRVAAFLLAIEKAGRPAIAFQARQTDIVLHGHFQNETLLLAVFRNQREPGGDGFARRADLDRLSGHRNRATPRRLDAEDCV